MGKQEWTNILVAGSILGGVAIWGMFSSGQGREWRNWWNADRYKTECRQNMKHIATACEMYSTDYFGRFPTSLQRLVPKYMLELPICPAAGEDTYSKSFQSASKPDYYTLSCKGGHHRQAGVPVELDYVHMSGLITQ